MRWRELEAEQARDLDYKIEKATAVISEALIMGRNPAVAFSGGKDSTVLLHLVRAQRPDVYVIYGNTGVEYPECVQFVRWLKGEWNLNLHEARPGKTDAPGYKYNGQRIIWQALQNREQLHRVLKPDGKLKSTAALEAACPPELVEPLQRQRLVWPAGTLKSYWWCVDQYGWPLLGKSWSRLEARRINIDTFLRFSTIQSDNVALLAYYEVLRQVKVSQACCTILKKEPAEQVQAGLGVDLIFKGLMAAEARARATNFLTRGYLFQGKAHPHLAGAPFWHCQPIAIWTDDDVWAYIRRYRLPYAKLYDMGWTDGHGTRHQVRRNGCMGCATDLLFPNNHMSMLRRTHPHAWSVFMRQGMAAEIQKLQRVRRNGQMSLFDVFSAEELLEQRPCIFDSLDRLVMQEEDTGVVFDPEVDGE